MIANDDTVSRSRWRFSLRSLFAGFGCLAVGMSCGGSSWESGLIATAATSLAIGLLQDAAVIFRSQWLSHCGVNVGSISETLGVMWRLCLSFFVAASLTASLLKAQGLWHPTDLNYSGLAVFEYVCWTALVLGYACSQHKWQLANGAGRPALRMIAASLAAIIFVVVIANQFEVAKLTHIALEGVERSQPLRWQRRWAYPIHAQEHHQFFWTALLAAICVCVSFGLLVAISHGRKEKPRPKDFLS